MKTTHIRPFVLGAIVLALFSFAVPVEAATKTKAPSLPFSEVVEMLENEEASTDSAKFDHRSFLFVFEPGEKNPEYGYMVTAKGTVQTTLQKNGTSTQETVAYLEVTEFNEQGGSQAKINIIRKGNTVFVQFKDGVDESIAGKWIRVPLAGFKSFGEKLGLDDAFDSAEVMTDEEDLEDVDIFLDLAIKHNLYVEYEKPTLKKQRGRQIVSYYYQYDPDKLAVFYAAYAKALKAEGKDEPPLFSVEGFEDGLEDESFVKAMAENSYLQISFDYETGESLEFVQADLIPASGMRDEGIQMVNTTRWTPTTKKAKIAAPKKYITSAEALQLFEDAEE